MTIPPKTAQLQIRVSPSQKASIQARAERAGLSMSEWVLSRLLPSARERLQSLVDSLRIDPGDRSSTFAAFLDWLEEVGADDLAEAIETPLELPGDSYWDNYVAATLEQAASAKSIRSPSWLAAIPGLEEPAFGSDLQSLRLHLLISSPPPFAARNLFVDTVLEGRV